MALSKDQKVAVQSTFASIEARPEQFASAFYGHLFEKDPSLRKLFKTELKEQGDVLVRMLTLAVGGLDHPDDMLPSLHDLGLHHAGYGVKTKDYDTFGDVLILTLHETLGTAFTPAASDAWQAFYGFLAASSIEGRQE